MSERTTYIYALHDPRDWSIRYVGKANNPASRLKMHIGSHSVVRMQKFIKELRLSGLTPTVSILQACSQAQWTYWEKFWIATARDSGADLINIAPGGNAVPALWPFSSEHRARLSAAARGRILSLEVRAKLKVARNGRTISPETRAKTSASLKGRAMPPTHRAKIGAANKGKKFGPLSLETRAKMSAARKGRKRSPETVAKMSAAHRGRKRSSETRARISEVQKGRKLSPETRSRMSTAQKRRWAKLHAEIYQVVLV